MIPVNNHRWTESWGGWYCVKCGTLVSATVPVSAGCPVPDPKPDDYYDRQVEYDYAEHEDTRK